MLLEGLGQVIAQVAIDLPTRPAVELLQSVLVNQRALSFATERLRPKYEPLVRPASFDHVAANFHLAKQDFVDYFQGTDKPSAKKLGQHLRSRLRTRAASWVHNRPTEEVFNSLVEDFYAAYEAFFITSDPALATLHLVSSSTDILRVVTELRSYLASRADISPAQRELIHPFPREVQTFLTVLQIPFEILEETPHHIDLRIVDPSGLFPTQLFVCGMLRSLDAAVLDGILQRLRSYGSFAHAFVVTRSAPASDVHSQAQRRGLVAQSFSEFRSALLKTSPDVHYVLGEAVCEALLESLGIENLYIPPSCTPVDPDEGVEGGFEAHRHSAVEMVESFLSDQDSRLLIILGEYGAGKSALCAHIAARMVKPSQRRRSVYIALRQLSSASDIARVVTKATQLVKTVAGPDAIAVVLLDGLDELANAMTPEERRHNMLRLLEASSRTDKLIVSARASYFRGLSDFWQLFARPGDNQFWDKLARHISPSAQRPAVSALALREFNNDQIELYLEAFGRAKGKGDEFVAQFTRTLAEHDPHGIYRRLARSPLYLFLIVNTEPWTDPTVKSIGDVLRLLTRYWLERDIEKGPSRWLLTTADRAEFLDNLAWWMFERHKVTISYQEFDEFVATFYDLDQSRLAPLTLDLQTTGFLSSSGNRIHFVLPAFMDYLVASRFATARFRTLPPRLPTGNQARIWLGFVETQQAGYLSWEGEEVAQWLREIGVEEERGADALDIDPRGILNAVPEDGNWREANKPKYKRIRAIIVTALSRHGDPTAQLVRVLVANPLGLHARPSARLVRSHHMWEADLGTGLKPQLRLRYEGSVANPGSIMEVMLLAVPGGCVFELLYENCSKAQAEDFLLLCGAEVCPVGAPADWMVWLHNPGGGL